MPSGKPIAGARVAPRLVQTEKTSYLGIRIPDGWLERLSAVTDGGGVATLRGLSRLVDLRSVRVVIPGRGTHVLMIPYSRGKEDVTLSVPRSGRLASQVVDAAGVPIRGARVDLWVRGGVPLEEGRSFYLNPERLPDEGPPLRSGPDGSFETPSALLLGSTYRVVARADGFPTLVSDWIKLTHEATHLPALRLLKPRVVEGRVIDRAGKPVAGAEVFSAGRAGTTTTDVSGAVPAREFAAGPLLPARTEGRVPVSRSADRRAVRHPR